MAFKRSSVRFRLAPPTFHNKFNSVGRDGRDAFLSLLKTCDKLDIPFWDYLDDRLAAAGNKAVPYLPQIVGQRCTEA